METQMKLHLIEHINTECNALLQAFKEMKTLIHSWKQEQLEYIEGSNETNFFLPKSYSFLVPHANADKELEVIASFSNCYGWQTDADFMEQIEILFNVYKFNLKVLDLYITVGAFEPSKDGQIFRI